MNIAKYNGTFLAQVVVDATDLIKAKIQLTQDDIFRNCLTLPRQISLQYSGHILVEFVR